MQFTRERSVFAVLTILTGFLSFAPPRSVEALESASPASPDAVAQTSDGAEYEILTTAPPASPAWSLQPNKPYSTPHVANGDSASSEQAAVEQALGRHDLGRHFAKFQAHRSPAGPTYAEFWYARAQRKHHRGKMLAGVGAPLLAIATALAVTGFAIHASNDSSDAYYDEDFGERFGATFFGILGTAGTVAMLATGLSSISNSNEQMDRLRPLLPENSPHRTKSMSRLRIVPTLTGATMYF